MTKKIFGLTGPMAAGKGTVAKYLIDQHAAVSYRISDPLRETLNIYDLETSRENLQALSMILRQQFGENLFAKAMAKRASQSNDDLILIDGIRRQTDIENLREVPGFHLIAIEVDIKTRHQRYVKRNENPGDESMDLKKFEQKSQHESELQIPNVMKIADFTIDNNGSLEQLYEQVEDILGKT